MAIFARFSQRWRNWWGDRVGSAKLPKLRPQDIKNVAREGNASGSAELQSFVGKWPDSANLLAQRMAALHIDPIAFRKEYPAVARELEKTCSFCKQKSKCEHDLKTSSTDTNWQRYCPNATTLVEHKRGNAGNSGKK
jgi:hypothetical protein